MKNIHLLPTDKEPVKGDLLLRHIWKDTLNECISWWRYNDTITIDGVVQYTTLNGSFRDIVSSFKVHHVYITSDEEIKDGDWFLEKAGRQYPIQRNGIEKLNFHCKKIILTTDELYIHNDLVPKEYNPSPQYVQKIDDEFLEWFVKNPSCEFVEVKNGVKRLNSDGEEIGFPDMSSYKIIIPKEENFKHELRVLSKEEVLTNRSSAYEFIDFDKQETLEEDCSCTDECLGYWTKSCKRIEEPKQETLEEAAEKWLNKDGFNMYNHYDTRPSFIAGSKWQAKRMYSEEELKSAFKVGFNIGYGSPVQELDLKNEHCEKWFEQFKKK